jgi:hypothetical protein
MKWGTGMSKPKRLTRPQGDSEHRRSRKSNGCAACQRLTGLAVAMSSLGRLCMGLCVAGVALASVLAPLPASAQEGLENVVSTAGTTIQDRAGRHWAYLFWQGSNPGLILGRTYAVYAKPGDPTSPAPYQRVSIVSQQIDPRNIEPLLRRAENVGEDPAKLEQDLHSLFEALMPAGSISRAEKVSAAIRGSLAQEEYFQNLLLMARIHPGVALALGVAYADVLPAQTTFEVRLFDPVTENDLGVIGRVTLVPGAPVVLPAPGAPVEVPDTTPKGDINVKLRWATPDPLRRLGLLQYGFNVWRVTKAYAEAASNRWDLVPPSPDKLIAAAAKVPAHVKRCNNLPILTDKDFGTNDVANFKPPPAGDPETYFYSDDDGRFRPGYVNQGFTNGARFYYFVTARDILGRDGFVSPGTLVTVCDRNPPLPPDGVRVVNDYSFVGGTPRQCLRVIWNQNTNTADPVTNYWVYRWTNLTEMHAKAGNPTNNRIAIVRHTNGLATTSYLDAGPGAPSVPADLGRTFWYTVRAQDYGACGPNLSGNSAPAFGVLRDRVGPDAPTGNIEIHCLQPQVRYLSYALTNPSAPWKFTFRLNCFRASSQIAWVQFVAGIYDPRTGTFVAMYDSGQLFYSPGDANREFVFSTDAPGHYGDYLQVWPKVVTFDGQMGQLLQPFMVRLEESWLPDKDVLIYFEARLVAARTGANQGCQRHTPVTPEGTRTNIVIIGYPTPTSQEWRLYRRVDDGPMTLLCHGAVGGAPSFSCQDDGLPPNGATICYYVQVLDEHGNPSPMVKLGCVTTAPAAPPPAPLLSPLLATGVTNNPGMTITWFCPPPGLERFEVWIAGKPNPVASNLAPGFLTSRPSSFLQPNPTPQTMVLNGATNTYDFYVFLTPRIGPGFGPGPEFNVPCSIELGETYTVFVKAVTRDGTVSEPSNVEQFVWNPANTNFPLCTIPWPARGLPPVNTSGDFKPADTNVGVGILAGYYRGYEAPLTGAVVLVGGSILTSRDAAQVRQRPQWLKGEVNPMSLLFTNAAGEKLFPMVLYRYQVPNERFAVVSGDIVQVSPMLENIAYEITNYCIITGNQRICHTNSLLRDSYIVYDRLPINDLTYSFFMLVPDTQPVISGARYKYLLVRFRKNGEIAEVIPTNEMDVP